VLAATLFAVELAAPQDQMHAIPEPSDEVRDAKARPARAIIGDDEVEAVVANGGVNEVTPRDANARTGACRACAARRSHSAEPISVGAEPRRQPLTPQMGFRTTTGRSRRTGHLGLRTVKVRAAGQDRLL